MQLHGFVRPSGAGIATRGWVHPDLALGFECVAVIAPEDIIADRMGQYASGSAPEMLGQARALFALCEGLDLDYMKRRISEETAGAHGLQDLQDPA